MSGVGFGEFVVLFVIGLLILGPERLPRVAAQIGRWIGKARRTANQLRYQLEREVALADIEEKKKTREKRNESVRTAQSSMSSGESSSGESSETSAASKPAESDESKRDA